MELLDQRINLFVTFMNTDCVPSRRAVSSVSKDESHCCHSFAKKGMDRLDEYTETTSDER